MGLLRWHLCMLDLELKDYNESTRKLILPVLQTTHEKYIIIINT